MEIKNQFPVEQLGNVKGVFIDLDDTLYQYSPCHKKALDKCYNYIKIGDNLNEFTQIYTNYRNLVKGASKPFAVCRSRLIAFKLMCNDFKLSLEQAVILDDLYWNSFIEYMTPSKQALQFLIECNSKRIPVCVVTDMLLKIQIRKLKKLNMLKYIDNIISSEEVGYEKPSAQIYNKALDCMGLKPGEVIMLGDHIEKDIIGAEELGIKSFHIDLSEEL